LDEYLLTLLLHHHPHNYSDELARSVPTPVPGIVRRRRTVLDDNAVSANHRKSDVADHLGISRRSLIRSDAVFSQRETWPPAPPVRTGFDRSRNRSARRTMPGTGVGTLRASSSL